MEFILLVLSILLASIKTLIQGKYIRKNKINFKDSFFFVAIFSFAALTILGALYLRSVPSLETILFGLIMGLCTAFAQVAYLQAFDKGPISITAITASLSILMPTLYGLMFLKEVVCLSKIIGIILVVASLILLNFNKGKIKVINFIYLLLVLATFLLTGSINIFQSIFNTLEVSNEKYELLFFVYLFSFVFSILFGLIIRPKQKINIHIKSISILSPILMGIFYGLQNALLMYLLPIFTASIYFPVTASLNVCFMTIYGIFIFKDKIKITQAIGVILAIAACIIINLVF